MFTMVEQTEYDPEGMLAAVLNVYSAMMPRRYILFSSYIHHFGLMITGLDEWR